MCSIYVSAISRGQMSNRKMLSVSVRNIFVLNACSFRLCHSYALGRTFFQLVQLQLIYKFSRAFPLHFTSTFLHSYDFLLPFFINIYISSSTYTLFQWPKSSSLLVVVVVASFLHFLYFLTGTCVNLRLDFFFHLYLGYPHFIRIN